MKRLVENNNPRTCLIYQIWDSALDLMLSLNGVIHTDITSVQIETAYGLLMAFEILFVAIIYFSHGFWNIIVWNILESQNRITLDIVSHTSCTIQSCLFWALQHDIHCVSIRSILTPISGFIYYGTKLRDNHFWRWNETVNPMHLIPVYVNREYRHVQVMIILNFRYWWVRGPNKFARSNRLAWLSWKHKMLWKFHRNCGIKSRTCLLAFH